MPLFQYGDVASGGVSNAMSQHYAAASRGKGRAMGAAAAAKWRDAESNVSIYRAWRAMVESAAFGGDGALEKLADAALASMPAELRPAVLAEALDDALGVSRFAAVPWLAGRGVGDAPPEASGARATEYLTRDGRAWELLAGSWSALAAMRSVAAIEAIEACGIGAKERAGLYPALAERAASESEEFFEFHPWVRLMGFFADARFESSKPKPDKDRMAAMLKAWEPREGAELDACKRALVHEAIVGWSPSAAKALAAWGDPISAADGKRALEVMAQSIEMASELPVAPNRAEANKAFAPAMAKWLAASGGPGPQKVFDSIAQNFLSQIGKSQNKRAGDHGAALVHFAKVVKACSAWGRVDPIKALGVASRASVELASRGTASPNDLFGMDRVKLGLAALDEIAGSRKSPSKRV